MAGYLGRDFLEEFTHRNLLFLQRSLLTVPTSANLISAKNDPVDDIINGILENRHTIIDYLDNVDDTFGDLCWKNNSLLSLYGENEDHKHTSSMDNIVAIDSDSDFGIFSSSDSSFMDEESKRTVESVIFGSLCPSFHDESSISDLILEELEEEEIMLDNVISKLLRYLKPVRIKEPFSQLIQKDIMFDESLQSYEIDEDVECNDDMLWTFTKVDMSALESDLQLDKVLLDEDDNHTGLAQNLPQIHLSIEDLPNLDEYMVSDTLVTHESYEVMEEDENTPIVLLPIKMLEENQFEEMSQNVDLLIDSPLSSMDSNSLVLNELPNECKHLEPLPTDDSDICTMSANSQSELMNRIETEERSYGDTLLMLLPDPKESLDVESWQAQLPPLPVLRSKFEKTIENHLQWDPIPNSQRIVKKCETRLKLLKFPEISSQVHDVFNDYFTPFPLHFAQDPDEVIEDWKKSYTTSIHLRHMTTISKVGGNRISASIQRKEKHPSNAKAEHVSIKKTLYKSNNEKIAAVLRNTPRPPLKPKTPATLEGTFQSPLDTFLLLRKGQFSTSTPNSSLPGKPLNQQGRVPTTLDNQQSRTSYQPTSSVIAAKVQPFRQEPTNTLESDPLQQVSRMVTPSHVPSTLTNVQQKGLPRKCDVVLSKEFLSILLWLEKDSLPLFEFLREFVKNIEKEMTLLKLNPDQARFMCKEDENKRSKGIEVNKDVTCGLICLHALTQSVELITHCSVLTACGVLKSFNQKYTDILRNCLEPIRKRLIDYHHQNEKKMVFHSKFVKIKELLSGWLLQQDNKVLVIFGRYYDQLATALKTFLSVVKSVHVKFYPNPDAEEEEYMETFMSSNVILAQENEDLQTCPWKLFNYVLQYEFRTESSWHAMAYAANPRLISFTMLDTIVGIDVDVEDCQVPISPAKLPCTIVCCQEITLRKELLLILENKKNITLLPKNFSCLKSLHSLQPDLLPDPNTGIIVMFQDDGNLEKGLQKVFSASMKCSSVHVIFTVYEDNKQWSSQVDHITTVIASCKSDALNIKAWYVFSVDELASLIRNIADSSSYWNKKNVWNPDEWSDEKLSNKEIFFLGYPFLNLLCAQMMIQSKDKPLKQIISMSLTQLRSTMPGVPKNILKSFHIANQQFITNGSIPNNDPPSPDEFINCNQPNTMFSNSCNAYGINKEEEFDTDVLSSHLQSNMQKAMPIEEMLNQDNNCNKSLLLKFQEFESFQNLNSIPLNQGNPVRRSSVNDTFALNHHPGDSFRFPNVGGFETSFRPIFTNTTSFDQFHSVEKPYHRSSNGDKLSNRSKDHCSRFDLFNENMHVGCRESEKPNHDTMRKGAFNRPHNKSSDGNAGFGSLHSFSAQNLAEYNLLQPSQRTSRSSTAQQNGIDFSIVPQQHSRHSFDSQLMQKRTKPFWQGSRENIPRQVVRAFPSTIRSNSMCTSRSYDNVQQTVGETGFKFLYNAANETVAKKRRLGFERVPGATNGQTRLTFK